MEQIIRTLIGHIQSSMPQLALVDEDYGQLEYIDKEDVDTYPLVMPAVLIDTPETSWTDTADGGQKGTCKVRVRLIIDCYDDTHATSGTSTLPVRTKLPPTMSATASVSPPRLWIRYIFPSGIPEV